MIGYLGDFLFAPQRARSPVKSLSGGERNRLLLARLFARPANVLVLDEPTNDLDIETLDLLEELLAGYDGTLFLVSHDRAFLDNVVTQVIAAEGDGRWGEYAGGYQEWQRVQAERTAERELAREAEREAARRAGIEGDSVHVDADASAVKIAKARVPFAPLKSQWPSSKWFTWQDAVDETWPILADAAESAQSDSDRAIGLQAGRWEA